MIVYDCEQNTDEWHSLRTGVITASQFKDVMTKSKSKGGVSLVRQAYMRVIAGEIITGERAPGFYSKHTERGHADEPKAIESYVSESGNDVSYPGFVTLDCGRVGCSPDAMTNGNNVECKSKLAEKHIAILANDEIPEEYKYQVHGQIWICEAEWCDFVSYSSGLPLAIVRQYRDDKVIKELKKEVGIFVCQVDELVDLVQSKS